eukprot:4904528-Pyramimonas_sp.AAC.1
MRVQSLTNRRRGERIYPQLAPIAEGEREYARSERLYSCAGGGPKCALAGGAHGIGFGGRRNQARRLRESGAEKSEGQIRPR